MGHKAIAITSFSAFFPCRCNQINIKKKKKKKHQPNIDSKPEKMMLSKCCTQYVSKSGRPSSGHRTGKGQSSSQFQRRLVLKNVQTIGQLHLSPVLVRSCLKSCTLGFSIMQTKNFRMSQAGFRKGRGNRSNSQHSRDHRESQIIPERHLPLFH